MRSNGRKVLGKQLVGFSARRKCSYLSTGCLRGAFILRIFFNAMKISWLSITLLAVIAINIQGQVADGYTVTERGADYRVLQKTTIENGTNHVHRYTELATGMNYTNSFGQLTESKEQISILPTGGAAATQGRHQVYFPADIYNGVLEVVTPDGRHLRSRPLCVGYDDGSNTVFIATLKPSQGWLTSSNQVTYFDAFTTFKADLVCTYRRGGYECDLVFRQLPPAPDQFGLDNANSTLQLVTEFFNTADPEQIPAQIDDWFGLQDHTLKFGSLTMTRGKAFAMKASNSASPVYKRWLHLQGRTFLIEEVPLVDLADDLNALPLAASANPRPVASKPSEGGSPDAQSRALFIRMASNHRQMPPGPEFVAGTNRIQIASADFNPEPGMVLDYVMVDSDGSNGFTGGETYLISGGVNVSGPILFGHGAGATVIKFSDSLDPNVYGYNPDSGSGSAALTCDGVAFDFDFPYCPIILTSMDDDSVGEIIPGSSGSPGTLNLVYLQTGNNATLESMHFCYAGVGLLEAGNTYTELRHCQFVNCARGIAGFWNDLELDNCLFAGAGTGVDNCEWSDWINLVNVTLNVVTAVQFAPIPWWADPSYSPPIGVTNCLINGLSSFESGLTGAGYSLSGANNGDISSNAFQPVGGGGCYLAANSPYRNAGTTNIDPGLLSDLRQRTTYPPTVIAGALEISADTTLYPRVQRDTDVPDLGYHYDAVDYLAGSLTVDAGATLTLADGVAIGVSGTNITVNGSLSAASYPLFPAIVTEQAVTPLSIRYNSSSAAYTDADGNGLPDWWEQQYFGHLGIDPNADADDDGVSNLQEYLNSTDPLNPDSAPPVRLGHWRFDNTNTWAGDAGQLPLLATNLVGVRSWSNNAVLIDSTNPAILCYRDVETNGNANINLCCGTVRFWFKPDWSSVGQPNGVGPQTMGRLIEMGNYNPAFTNGWWALYFNPDGTQLAFGSSTNGAGTINPSAPISWTAKRWHQIVLTYSPTNSSLYLDGNLEADVTGTNYFPNLTERTNGFRIGSDANGGNQAAGVFEELETFNYQLNTTDIASDYANAINSMPVPPTVIITSPTSTDSIRFVGPNRPLTVTVDTQVASGQSIQEVDYTFDSHQEDVPSTSVSTNQYPFSCTWMNADWTNAFVGGYNIKAVAIDSLGVASGVVSLLDISIVLDSDGDGMPDYWMLLYFGHPTGEAEDNSLAGGDADCDGVSNLQEYQNGTDPIAIPVLEILGGNNQAGNYNSFLPLPITIQLTGADSKILTNFPVVFSVPNGTALLALTNIDVPTNTLFSRTDSNGQASVCVCFPPAGPNPPDSSISISASSGINSATASANEYVLLGHWRFDDTNAWRGDAGQLPLLTNNLVGVPSWSSNAVVLDNTSPTLLTYRVVETNGNININCQTGSVLFYFKSDWGSDDETQGGTGPGTSGRLIEMGSYDPEFTHGWWSLYFSPDGTQLLFATAANGNGMTNLSTTISWVSNKWHQVALAYSPTGSALFVDGQLAVTGDGVTNLLNSDELANGFRIGSDQDGNNQAKGTFDELVTFASPVNGIGEPVETFWLGIPDYQADPNGTLGAWEMAYFGHLGVDPNGDYDNDGTSNLQAFMTGTDPNKISFSFSVPYQYVTTNVISGVITIMGGVPSSIAVVVNPDNSTVTNWNTYTSSNITVTFGTNQGARDIWVGLRGLPENAQPTWEETSIVLDSTPPVVSITSPADGASLNASRVNISGNFTARTLKQITVNGTIAFVNGTNFEARNVLLNGGANIVMAIIEDLTDMTNAASITVTGTTNADGSLNDPVQLQALPIAGFVPLPVAFQITNDTAPGTLQQVLYDFNGDGIIDLVTNNLLSLTHAYETNGEYFPVVIIQTDAGRFSSVGGWNSGPLDSTNQPVRINVQLSATQMEMLSYFQNPVDLKWDGTHLYVLFGSGAAVYEFATNGTTIRWTNNIGATPSGFDVDGAGNVYVAVKGNNQVWKFNPTEDSFVADTNFGIGGCIGLTNGTTGTGASEFNSPYDVAVSPDGGTISVSDSGNHRIQQFSAANGAFTTSFGSQGNAVGQFNNPKGLTYDALGILYIVDSGNNRIVLAQGSMVLGATGNGGSALGQFSGPLNISIGKRGVYVADTGNGRIQKFDLPAQGLFVITPGNVSYALSTNLSSPTAVAAVDNLTDEMFYVADTGHDRVLLCHLPDSNADEILAVWNSMTACVANRNISGATTYFSSQTADRFCGDFLCIGAGKLISDLNQIGTLTPVYIENNEAQYYFEQTIYEQPLLFPVQFTKENGVWKILEF